MDTIKFYNQLLSKNKDNSKSLGWGSKESQELRFKILCEIENLKDKTILDYGCGVGDLYQFLKKYKIREYIGYDINQNMVSMAMKKYPDGIFRNYLEAEIYDYVLASGIFNLKTENWCKETYGILRKMWGMCRRGMAVNFLSSFSKYKDKKCFYTEPSEILRFVGILTPKFILRQDYKENDFTIYAYK